MGIAADDGAVATIGAKISTGTVYAGASASVLGALGLSDWLALGGFMVAIATFGVNIYYRRKKDARDKRLADDAHEESLQRQRLNTLETQARIATMGNIDDPDPA